MAWKLGGGAIVALLLAVGAAQGSEATMLAERAGFLLGHAHRCGVAEDRLQRSATILTEVIAAFSSDDEDSEEARARFVERALAGAMAGLLADPVPRCAGVRSALVQLEQRPGDKSVSRHQRERHPAGGNRSVSALPQPDPKPAAHPLAKPVRSAKAASTRRQNPTSQRRAAQEPRQAARQSRG
jgi:hypothetical protein